MRRILLLFVGLLFFVNLFAQNWDWALHIESTGDNTEVVDVVRDGNYLYTYGIFRGTLTLGGIDYASVGNNDLYLVKTNLDGEVQWVRIAGSSGNELASHVRVDESHNVYISGGFQNNCDFDGQNIISSDGFDGFIAKYDSGGTIQWARNIAWGTGNDKITGMAVDNDGTVFVTGLFINDVVIGDVSTNDTYNAGTDPRRMFVASFNTDASYNWSVEFANTGSQTIFRALTLAEDNSIYVGGANNGTITIGGNGYTTRGSGDIILVKLSSSGVPQWVRTAGGGGTSDDQLNSIVDFDNNVYIIGYVQNTGNIDQNGVDPPLSYSASSVDIITARYNSEGSLIWHTVIGGAGADSGYGIQIHENIMVCSGYFSSNVTFNDDIIASGGGFDAGFFVFDLDGNPITASSVSGTLEDRGQAVIYDGVGNTYIGGFFKSSNLSIGSLDLLSNAYSPLKDGFLAKYQNPFSATFTTKKNVSCSGGSDGELTVTTYFGTEPYTYSWTKDGSAYGSDTHTLTNLSAGVYEVTVTDANTKEASTTYTITQPTAITAGTPDINNVTCFGGDDGAIDIHPSGGTGTLTYFWTTDDGFGLETTTQDQTGLIAGTYCVCITDANGCEFTDSYTLTDPDEIVITGSVTDITNPGSNGAITISDVSGGTGTYPDDFSFSWVGPNSFTSSDEDIIGLSDAGEYSVTVTDGVGCSQDKTYSVVDEQQFSIWISSKTNVLCNGNSTGSATVSYFKPTGFPDNPIAYSWTLSGGVDVLSSDATVAGLLAGTYKVVVNYDDD
ncbi:MAG: SprB repeat-containing protein, partial [Bacteroidales bacterium]|nr:SprB repeat-containing protein [Bacteroidales bacterium]